MADVSLERVRLMEQRLDNMMARKAPELQGEPEHRYREIQSRSDEVLRSFSDAVSSPTFDESLDQYTRRCLTKVKNYSQRWKDADISYFRGPALAEVGAQIFDDAMKEIENPARVPAGELREVVKYDRTGRGTSRFIGDPEACWGPFKMPIRLWRPR